MKFLSSLVKQFLLIQCVSFAQGVKDVTIENFANEPEPYHVWFSLNDPVMGGLSTGTFVVKSDEGVGVFDGEVKDVPSLKAPGFIAMRTGRRGFFPDLQSCDGLQLNVRTPQDIPVYDGYRISIGTNYAGDFPYAKGYKTHFDLPAASDDFQSVFVKFDEFSDNWDPRTGEIVVSCEENNQYCPDDATLKNLEQIEIMAEGVKGKVYLEIKSILATNCDDDVSETNPNPDEDPYRDSNNINSPVTNGGGRNNNFSRFQDHEKDSVGGYGGYMAPTILENGDVRIESFEDPQHRWFPTNDPVMGGSSVSTVTIKNDVGIFDGEVVDVDFLGAPGFIKMETRGGNFPDVSMCTGLKIQLKSSNSYDGIRVSFGTHHADDAMPYVRGYKAHMMDAPQNEFGEIVMPFSEFSDSWDAGTGDIVVSCAEDKKHCVDERTLKDFMIFSFMGEGVDGKVHLEIKSIDATGCKHGNGFGSALGQKDGNKIVMSTSGLVSLVVVGSFLVGFVSFFVGRRYGKRAGFIEPPSVEVTRARGDIL